MKKIFKILPLLLVLIYAIFLIFNNLENQIKIIGFSFGAIFLLYLIFMISTEKYIDLKDGMKIKNLGAESKKEANHKIQPNYLSISIYIVGLILFIIYLYNSIFLNIQLPYLLYILIAITSLSLVLSVRKIK